MRRGFVFETARAGALASILWLPCLSLVKPAHGAPRPDQHDAGLDGGQPAVNAVIQFLQEFWTLAWGADFNLNQSGMSLDAAGLPGVWTVSAHDQLDTIGAGQYVEIISLPLPGLDGASEENGLTLEQHMTVGLFSGSTGFSIAVYGLRQHILAPGEGFGPTEVNTFTPMGMSEELGVVLEDAMADYELLSEDEGEEDDDPDALDPCSCYEIHDNDVSACFATALGCEGTCTAAALAAIAGCGFSGPLVPICISLVVAGQVICIASCVANQRACNLRAKSDLIKCNTECEQDG